MAGCCFKNPDGMKQVSFVYIYKNDSKTFGPGLCTLKQKEAKKLPWINFIPLGS